MFRVRHEHVWADRPDSISIAHLSDLHVWSSRRLLDRLDRHLREDPPEVVALTGDMFDFPSGARLVANFLREVASTFPVVYVLGNHDRLWGRHPLESIADIPGCHFLTNKPFRIETSPGRSIEFVDISRQSDLPASGTVRIGLAHDPETIPPEGIPGVHLALAGHLHGGQFVFWKNRQGALYPGSFLYRNLSDRKTLGSTHLVVSRGLGDTLALRWNCPREVVRIHLGA